MSYNYILLKIPQSAESISSQIDFPKLETLGKMVCPFLLTEGNIIEYNNVIYTIVGTIFSSQDIKLIIQHKQDSLDVYAFQSWKKAMKP